MLVCTIAVDTLRNVDAEWGLKFICRDKCTTSLMLHSAVVVALLNRLHY